MQEEVSELMSRVSVLEAKAANTEKWQERQNGDIQEIRRMQFQILTGVFITLAASVLSIVIPLVVK